MLRANIRLARQQLKKSSSSAEGENMSSTGNKKAIIFLFPDFEETEFVITANVLRRAGIDLTVVGVEQNEQQQQQQPIKGCQNIFITPDKNIKSVYESKRKLIELNFGLIMIFFL